jgi:glycosyltransferase involved in cell wall biosynthesis
LIVGGEFGDSGLGRKKELEGKAKMLGLKKHVTFTGFLSNIADIIQIFDVGVNVTEREACSRAILEIMATGKPVVAFDTGGNSELIKNDVTGKLVKFGDIVGLADSISDLLKDDEKKKKMGKFARKIIKTKFNVKMNTDQTENIYFELLKL